MPGSQPARSVPRVIDRTAKVGDAETGSDGENLKVWDATPAASLGRRHPPTVTPPDTSPADVPGATGPAGSPAPAKKGNMPLSAADRRALDEDS
jgi:hypothetical protein